MGLIGNYSVLSKNPGRAFSGSTVSGDRGQWNTNGASRNAFTNSSWSPYSAIPLGYGTTGRVWPIKAGLMAAVNEMHVEFLAAVVLGTPSFIVGPSSFAFVGAAVSYATGNLEGHITPFETLSPQNLAAAVWNSFTIDYVIPTTFGAVLGAGASVDPQVVRDAMLLTPTAGTPGTDSVDAKLNTIKSLAGLIPAAL